MKMITAIVNKRDADSVCDALTSHNFMFTKMATTGGFLRSGNMTLLIGTEDDKVKKAVEAGAEPVTLGKRILRTETAGMTVLSILMYLMEED